MAKVKNGITYVGGTNSASTVTEYVFKVMDIGPWDMDVATILNVPHGLSATEWKTITGLSGTIIDDAGTTYTICAIVPDGTAFGDVRLSGPSSTNLQLSRLVGGVYDNALYNSTGVNRGHISFWYKPD